jgi:hypothetical protein
VNLTGELTKTVCIIDRAAQYTEEHYAKGNDPKRPGTDYVSLVKKAFPGYDVTYFEYYWDEKTDDFVVGPSTGD